MLRAIRPQPKVPSRVPVDLRPWPLTLFTACNCELKTCDFIIVVADFGVIRLFNTQPQIGDTRLKNVSLSQPSEFREVDDEIDEQLHLQPL